MLVTHKHACWRKLQCNWGADRTSCAAAASLADGAPQCGFFGIPRGLGLAAATTSAAFLPHCEQRIRWPARDLLPGNEAELVAGRALNELRDFKLEP